ncbi:hypothetical protein Tco_0127941 [Tanacetum coccineum]|uniref:Uncharacterized protein n=1 Tax=Tanacetum coccineum TaxID=301880 RepID=A0ABQ4YYT6_9ASTR
MVVGDELTAGIWSAGGDVDDMMVMLMTVVAGCGCRRRGGSGDGGAWRRVSVGGRLVKGVEPDSECQPGLSDPDSKPCWHGRRLNYRTETDGGIARRSVGAGGCETEGVSGRAPADFPIGGGTTCRGRTTGVSEGRTWPGDSREKRAGIDNEVSWYTWGGDSTSHRRVEAEELMLSGRKTECDRVEGERSGRKGRLGRGVAELKNWVTGGDNKRRREYDRCGGTE